MTTIAVLQMTGGIDPAANAETLAGAVADFRRKGVATAYDEVVAGRLANVLTGGEADLVDAVTEQQLLDLERDAFMESAHDERTHARVESMLMTGKPLRN